MPRSRSAPLAGTSQDAHCGRSPWLPHRATTFTDLEGGRRSRGVDLDVVSVIGELGAGCRPRPL